MMSGCKLLTTSLFLRGFFCTFHHINLGIFVLHIFPHEAFNELKILNVIFKKLKVLYLHS